MKARASRPLRLRWLLPLLLASTGGCISYCQGSPVLVRAAQGDRASMDETGNLGRPRIPSTAERLPLIADAFAALTPGLASPSEATRVAAVEALRHLSERCSDVWRNSYHDVFDGPLADPSREVRWRAAWAMERLGATSPALRTAAEDPDDLVAQRALGAVGRAFDEEALTALERGLGRATAVSDAARGAVEKLAGRALPDAAAARAYLAERRKLRGASTVRPQDTAPVGS